MSNALRIFEGRFGRVLLVSVADSSAPHAHIEHQLLLKYDGADRRYLIDGDIVSLTRDSIVFLSAGRQHASLANEGGEASRLLQLNISRDWLAQTFPAVFRDADSGPQPRVRDTITPHLRKVADAMVIDMQNDRFLSADRLEFMVQELILSIIDAYFAKRRASSPMWRGSRYADARIRRSIALLRARPNKDVNMDDIAAQVGLSRSRFYDLFQMCTGRSPREYLDMLCVETAITRLSTSNTKIGEVSAELGFSAQSNFTRFFLNQVGASPSEYRRLSSSGTADGEPNNDAEPESALTALQPAK